VFGVPARQTGWVSQSGVILDDTLTCPETGQQYELVNGKLQLQNG